ncbi:MAG TPA: EF-hand domain-containing protein, partial [Tepidisphaeraceae bacterium]|nr:EF-hand domain-containing protein [Tepidisphaeraceae bacterium]
MFNRTYILTAALALAAFSPIALAQPAPAPPPPAAPPAAASTKDYSNSPLVTKMMAFDKNKDGKLTKDEITDPRLQRLFDEADANHDGIVTKEELMALAAQLDAQYPPRARRGFGGPRGGPGDNSN